MLSVGLPLHTLRRRARRPREARGDAPEEGPAVDPAPASPGAAPGAGGGNTEVIAVGVLRFVSELNTASARRRRATRSCGGTAQARCGVAIAQVTGPGFAPGRGAQSAPGAGADADSQSFRVAQLRARAGSAFREGQRMSSDAPEIISLGLEVDAFVDPSGFLCVQGAGKSMVQLRWTQNSQPCDVSVARTRTSTRIRRFPSGPPSERPASPEVPKGRRACADIACAAVPKRKEERASHGRRRARHSSHCELVLASG